MLEPSITCWLCLRPLLPLLRLLRLLPCALTYYHRLALVLVPPRPPALLHVITQPPWHTGVYDQPDVGNVNT